MQTAFVLEEDAIGHAHLDGVLSAQEAFALEELADTEEPVPEWLHDAVERLFLWACCDGEQAIH
jgi:hypothetical protein